MKKAFIISLFLLGIGFAACQKPDVPDNGTTGSGTGQTTNPTPTYTIDIPSTEDMSPVFDAQGGEISIKFTASNDWTAKAINERADSWIAISPNSGKSGNSSIKIIVSANETTDERSATVQLKCGSAEKNIVVTQKQKDALTVTQSRFDVPVEGADITVEVKSNISFEYKIEADGADWIREIETKAMSTTTLQFSVAENDDVQKREGTITISNGEIAEAVKIYQEGAEPAILVSQNEYTVSADGETIQIEVNSNVDVTATIQDGIDWIRETTTKAMSTNTYYFTIDANDSFEAREASIVFENELTGTSESVRIVQNCSELITVGVQTKGALQAALSGIGLDTIRNLKISGVLNDVDFFFIRNNMPNLRYLDIAEVNIDVIPGTPLSQSNNLEKIILPNTLTEIGGSSLSQKQSTFPKSLKSVFIPDGVKIIRGCAFLDCISLTSIEIPASVETIGSSAFEGCSSLSSVTFEKGSQLKTIDGGAHYGAFLDCISLTSIEIPASVETIGRSAFQGCSSLATVTFEKGSQLKTIDGYSTEYYSFGAFSDCISLTSIEIPASVETIGRSAFQGCSSLSSVTFEKGSQLKTIDGVARYGAFSDCISLTSIEIPASVETIGRSAFQGCSSLATVTFEKGSQLKTIDGYSWGNHRPFGAFSDCISLTSIEIPASVETIGEAAFQGCSSLATVTFEKGSQLKTICGDRSYNSYPYSDNNGAFSNLKNLAIFDMSECTHVESIASYAFLGDSKLSLVLIGTENPPKMDSYSFYGISSYSVLKVPSGSVEAYKEKYYWNRFSSISALDE